MILGAMLKISGVASTKNVVSCNGNSSPTREKTTPIDNAVYSRKPIQFLDALDLSSPKIHGNDWLNRLPNTAEQMLKHGRTGYHNAKNRQRCLPAIAEDLLIQDDCQHNKGDVDHARAKSRDQNIAKRPGWPKRLYYFQEAIF